MSGPRMTHSPDGASGGGLDLVLEKFERFLRVNRLVGDGFTRNGEILSWADFDTVIAALRALSPSPGLGDLIEAAFCDGYGEGHNEGRLGLPFASREAWQRSDKNTGSAGADIARTEPHSSVLTSTPCQSEWSAGHVLRQVSDFLADLASADLDESAADGGVTVGMVFQQQARDVYGPRVRAALSSEAPSPKAEEQEPERIDWAADEAELDGPFEIHDPSGGEAGYRAPREKSLGERLWDILVGVGFVQLNFEDDPYEKLHKDIRREFERAAATFAALPPPGGGKGEGKQEDSPDVAESAARIASDHAATAPQCKSEGEG